MHPEYRECERAIECASVGGVRRAQWLYAGNRKPVSGCRLPGTVTRNWLYDRLT
ncbi:MAG: hypothetical protein IPI97_15445 [Nitrosomonas sp.]|nr:hypothetical protein [Nitrosomonas sp.]